MPSSHTRICPICEAACGLRVLTEGRNVLSCRGNPDDVFSQGHICPKGVALAELDADPDRLRTPLVRRGSTLEPASWRDAMEAIAQGLNGVRERHGTDAVALYIGNPTAHNIGLAMGIGPLAAALGTRNFFSAGTVDQVPKQVACELMYGNDMAIAVPDIARCDLLLMLGANPIVSNGSLWMVPNFRGKLVELQRRGGALIVVDPRRTETAKLADDHLFIRPGTDAWLLAVLVRELDRLGRKPPPRLAARAVGFDRLLDALAEIDVDRAAAHTGIPADDIRALAMRLHAARAPVLYGRVGTTLQRFGTLTSFLIDTLNVQLGALDAPGGAMFGEQPFAAPHAAPSTAPKLGRWRSRISGYPEVLGQMPVACLVEEMETAGRGQIRALVALAGNPVVSTPDSDRLDRALASLDFVVSVDIYRNETNRHAHVILPGTSPFEDGHYDQFLGSMMWRNTARYSPPLFPLADRPDEWRTMLGMAFGVQHGRAGSEEEIDALEDAVIAGSVRAQVDDVQGRLHGRDVQEIFGAIEPARGVERLLDLGIRAGRWGDAFGKAQGLTLRKLEEAPNGIDVGALEPALDRVLHHADGKIRLAAEPILDEVRRLHAAAHAREPDELLLIGRRNIQTNNSWLHNLPVLAKGPARCVLDMHPDDAAARGLQDGQRVRVCSSVASVVVHVRVTPDIAPGVVSMPHGFSAGVAEGQTRTQERARMLGAENFNRLAAARDVDVPSATAALNGIPVRCEAFRGGV